MRGLTIIVAEDAPERFRTALTLVAAQAALGGSARLFLLGEAVALIAGHPAPADERHIAAGMPPLAMLLAEALDLGVALIACQSGLHLCGLDASTIDPRIDVGGPVLVMQTLGDDRLLCV